MKRQGINGDLITKYREQNRLTQAKFATRLNKKLGESGVEATYSDKAISMWENGNRQPADINVLKAIAKTIGVSLDALCFMDEEKEAPQKEEHSDEENKKAKELLCNFINENIDTIVECRELAMYCCAETIEQDFSDINNAKEVKEFWLSVPLEPLATGDITWASQYGWDDGHDLFDEYTNGAKQISEWDFRANVLNYLLENEFYLRENYDADFAVNYVDLRFDPENHIDFYYMFLRDCLDELGLDMDEVKVDVVKSYYTDKGMLLRIRVSLRGAGINILKINCCNILDDADKWKETNKKAIEELIEIE